MKNIKNPSFYTDDILNPIGNILPFSIFNQNLFGKLSTDIKETEKSYIVECELPGFKKENINISMNNNVLTIDAESTSENDENEKSVKHIHERRFGKYTRSFRFIDDSVDISKIKASFDNGILVIELPKTEQNTNETTKINID